MCKQPMTGEMCLETSGLLACSESDRLWHIGHLFSCTVSIDCIDTGFLSDIVISN